MAGPAPNIPARIPPTGRTLAPGPVSAGPKAAGYPMPPQAGRRLAIPRRTLRGPILNALSILHHRCIYERPRSDPAQEAGAPKKKACRPSGRIPLERNGDSPPSQDLSRLRLPEDGGPPESQPRPCLGLWFGRAPSKSEIHRCMALFPKNWIRQLNLLVAEEFKKKRGRPPFSRPGVESSGLQEHHRSSYFDVRIHCFFI